jgi:hypothetical protein
MRAYSKGGLMRARAWIGWVTLVGLLIAHGSALPQVGQPSATLAVSGFAGQAPVTQINGNSYVAVDALARLMSGSLAYHGSHIMLTVPAGGTVLPVSQRPDNDFSKDFLKTGIETMSDIREWRSALLNAIENSYPVKDAWMDDYRAQAAKNLRLTSVAATTASDRNALQLLTKEFDHMQALGNKILAARKNLNYITSDIVKKDPLDQKVLNCARSLAAMAASGVFQDDGSCN